MGPCWGVSPWRWGGQGVLYHLPLALADALGYFRVEGLEVVVRDFAAGALAQQAVQEGAADVCSGAFEHVLRAQVRGQAYRALVLQGRAPQLALGVSLRSLPAYKDLGDLAGRRIGVSSVGSSTHLAASLTLVRAGVSPRDVSFVGVGSGTNAMNALRSGQVHALCHADPIMTLLEQKADTRIVGDLRSLKAAQELVGSGTLPAGSLYAPQAFLQKQPAQAQALVNGIVHALKWLQTAGPADLVKAVPAAYLMGDRGAVPGGFWSRARDLFAQWPDARRRPGHGAARTGPRAARAGRDQGGAGAHLHQRPGAQGAPEVQRLTSEPCASDRHGAVCGMGLLPGETVRNRGWFGLQCGGGCQGAITAATPGHGGRFMWPFVPSPLH